MMTDKVNLIHLIRSKLWHQLTTEYTPRELSRLLSFRDALRVAYRLLYNRGWHEDLQYYAIHFFEEIRALNPIEWNRSWKYDALLGLAYYLTCEHEKRYEAYKRAFDRANTHAPRLLIEMAQCAVCPGSPPIDRRVAIDLVKQALQKGLFSDGISVLCMLYGGIGDEEQKTYWTDVLKNCDKKIESPSIEPEFLGDEYFRKEGDLGSSATIEKSSIFYEDNAPIDHGASG